MINEMLDVNKSIILIDIEKNPLISHEVVRSIQDKLVRNKVHHVEERKREWKERKELTYEEDNIKKIIHARDEEIKTVKEIQKKAQEIQLKREQIYIETLKRQEEDRKKYEQKLEKEALLRAKGKKRRTTKKKK